MATLLTMSGLAIGLGNVWRFPYMMGQHGGSAFLLIYVLFMITLAAPALSAEWSLGRAVRGGPLLALRTALGPRLGPALAALFLFAAFMATCYYSVVVAQVLSSAWFAATNGFSEQTLAAYRGVLGEPGRQFAWALALLAACLWVVRRGLRGGIEVVNRLLLPLFGLASIYLVAVSLSLEGAPGRLLAYLAPDFSAAGPSVWFAAMGQACFSVGLSGTLGVMYGAYLADRAPIAGTATATCAVDLGAAILASGFVVPAVLVFGLDLAAGPGLLFETLPRLFAAMPGGRWLAPAFLLGWALVAMLTLIAVIDTLCGALAEWRPRGLEPHRARRRALVPVGLALVAVTAPIAWNPQWIGVLDLLFGSGLFMLGALVATLAVGWGLGPRALREQLAPGLADGPARWLANWIRWVVPTALTAILAGFLWSTLTGH
jgi:NSS family neurotransmitter:Na+ symporter